MKLIGKEYRRRLVPVEAEVKTLKKSWMQWEPSSKVKKIWEKRRCFICHGKFHEGDSVTIALTDIGNKMICPKCCVRLMTGDNIDFEVDDGEYVIEDAT